MGSLKVGKGLFVLWPGLLTLHIFTWLTHCTIKHAYIWGPCCLLFRSLLKYWPVIQMPSTMIPGIWIVDDLNSGYLILRYSMVPLFRCLLFGSPLCCTSQLFRSYVHVKFSSGYLLESSSLEYAIPSSFLEMCFSVILTSLGPAFKSLSTSEDDITSGSEGISSISGIHCLIGITAHTTALIN